MRAQAASSTPAARRQRYEQRLRNRVRSERACLGSLPPTTRELLGLRAGLGGSPLTRSEAATQLGISRSTATRLERSGLVALHSACGGPSSAGGNSGANGAASARLIGLAQGAPALQPAVYLPASTAPSLRPAADLHHPRGKQQVEGATASSPPPSSSSGPVSAAATSSPLGQGGGGSSLPIVMAACLAALAALMLVALRRRAVVQQRGSAMTAAVATPVRTPSAPRNGPAPVVEPAAPAPSPPQDRATAPARPTVAAPAPTYTPPHETGWPGPSADRASSPAAPPAPAEPEQHGSDASRLARSATVVASNVVSFAVRELVRRRAKRRR
jgi:hypothetical protein